jgi:predicted DCC family thiol-disulfide oxidoreductase YuxK
MAILLFDGECNLCNGSVQWILKHDHKAYFKFASLQSPTGQKYLSAFNLPQGSLDTTVLIDENQVFTYSDAPLQVLRKLGFPWSLCVTLSIVPRFLRDGVYRWVARNRYRWFGKSAQCWLPRPEWKDRFLDGLAQ